MAKGTDIFTANFADYLPDALKQDEKMRSLAAAVTQQLLEVSANVEDVLIYSRIDELPEALVDVLAYDMHIDWYDYSYPLEVKRSVLKSSVRVHKKMGTKYATEQALGAVWSQSEIEEWFQYGGEPHHFHIICDTSKESIMASYTEIVNAVKMYKRLSSHLDDVTYQSRIYLTIQTHTDYYIFKAPLTGRLAAGTHPQRNRKGVTAASAIIVGTDAAGFVFAATPAGTVPERNRVFRGQTVQIDAQTALEVFKYRNIPAGRIKAGEEPQRARRGANAAASVKVEDAGEAFTFSVVAAGTVPERSTVQRTGGGTIENIVEAAGFRHTSKACGSKRRL